MIYSRLPHNPYPQKPTFLDNSLDIPIRNFALLLVGLLLVSFGTHMPYEFKLRYLDLSQGVWVMRESTVLE